MNRSTDQMCASDPWDDIGTAPAPAPGEGWQGAVAVAWLVGSSGAVLRLWWTDGTAHSTAPWLLVALGVWATSLGAVTALPGRLRQVPALLVAGVTLLIFVPVVGRAPVVVGLGSVGLVAVATSRPVPAFGWPRRSVQTAIIAMLFIGAAQVSWIRAGSVPTVATLSVAAAVVLCWYEWAPASVGVIDRAVRRAVTTVADVLSAAIVMVVAVFAVYLPGAVIRLARALSPRRHRGGMPTWNVVVGSPGADAARPFIVPPAPVRRRRHLVAAGVSVVVVAVVGAAVLATRSDAPESAAPAAQGGSGTTGPSPSGEQTGDGRSGLAVFDRLGAVPYSERPAMAGQAWADDLQDDLAGFTLVEDPVVGYRNGDAESRYVNVRGGERRTTSTTCNGCPEATIWLVGGSAVFGVGQRDDHTISSELVRLAARRGVALEVRNLGVVGWTIWQEATDVRGRLDAGEPAPDAVVFLDGFNDSMANLAAELAGDPETSSPVVLDDAVVAEALDSGVELGSDQAGAAAARTVRSYSREQDRIATMLEDRGISSLFVFQPDAFSSPFQLADVRGLYQDVPALLQRSELDAVLSEVVGGLGGRVVDRRDVYDGVTSPLFIDIVHTNETGAALVAESVIAEVLALVADEPGSAGPD